MLTTWFNSGTTLFNQFYIAGYIWRNMYLSAPKSQIHIKLSLFTLLGALSETKREHILTLEGSESRSVVSSSVTPWNCPWNSPGQNIGVGSLSLLQWIFPTQGLNPGLPHLRQILYQLSHQESPRILEWVASPFSRGSFQWASDGSFGVLLMLFPLASILRFEGMYNHLVFFCIFLMSFWFCKLTVLSGVFVVGVGQVEKRIQRFSENIQLTLPQSSFICIFQVY